MFLRFAGDKARGSADTTNFGGTRCETRLRRLVMHPALHHQDRGVSERVVVSARLENALPDGAAKRGPAEIEVEDDDSGADPDFAASSFQW